MLSKDFFTRSNVRTSTVNVPGYEPVRVRDLTYAEYEEVASIMRARRVANQRENEGGVVDPETIRGPARIIVLTLGNEDGSRMLSDDDIADVMRQPHAAVMAIAVACAEHVFALSDVEAAEKK